ASTGVRALSHILASLWAPSTRQNRSSQRDRDRQSMAALPRREALSAAPAGCGSDFCSGTSVVTVRSQCGKANGSYFGFDGGGTGALALREREIDDAAGTADG